MSQTLHVVAAVIEKDGRFLITKRLKTSHLGHCWEFPGGKIEAGETLEECIVRECQEEIGVDVQPIRKIDEKIHSYPEVTVHLYFLLCKIVSGTPQPIECADCRWVLPQELSSFEFPAGDLEVIQKLQQSNF